MRQGGDQSGVDAPAEQNQNRCSLGDTVGSLRPACALVRVLYTCALHTDGALQAVKNLRQAGGVAAT